MLPSELLIAAKAVITSPECWTTDTFARNAQGMPVSPWAPTATCWCSVGAMQKVGYKPMEDGAPNPGLLYGDDEGDTELIQSTAIHFLFHAFGPDGIGTNNDRLSHSGVMAVWDKAIEAAKRKEVE